MGTSDILSHLIPVDRINNMVIYICVCSVSKPNGKLEMISMSQSIVRRGFIYMLSTKIRYTHTLSLFMKKRLWWSLLLEEVHYSLVIKAYHNAQLPNC